MVPIKRIIYHVIVVCLLCAGVDALVLQMVRHERQLEHRQQVQIHLDQVRAALDSRINSSLLLMRALASYIAVHPTLDQNEFRRISSEVLVHRNYLLNLVAAPNCIIRYVYPQEGNEALVGLDYRDLPDQWRAVRAALVGKTMVVDGPIPLVQGGTGIVGRIPVFSEVDQQRYFWGVISAVIDNDTLFEQVSSQAAAVGLDIAIRQRPEHTVFWGEAELFSALDSVQTVVSLPGRDWEMAARAKSVPALNPRLMWFLHGGFMMFAGLLIWACLLKLKNDFVLETSEKRMRDILVNSSGWIWETDAESRYTMVAGQVKHVLGYSPHELEGEELGVTVSEKQRDEFHQRLKQCRDNAQTLTDMEIWHTNKSKEQVCLLATIVPVFNTSGRFVGYRGAYKDITTKKGLQLEIEENKNLLDLFFAQSMDGFFFMMLDEPVDWFHADSAEREKLLDYAFSHQRMTRVNEAILEQYQVSEEDLLGRTPAELYQHDLEEGKRLWRHMFDYGRLHAETSEKRDDGSNIVIEGDYRCIYNRDGDITGHFGVQRDITASRHAEHELKRYIEIVDANVLTSQTDLEGRIIYASEAFCRISGYEVDELLGQDHNIVRHPDMPASIFEEMWRTIREGKTWHGEVKNKTRSGGFCWTDTIISPMEDSGGNVYGYMAVRNDITDKKRIEEISVTDALTGIFNRLKLDEVLENEHARFIRYGQKFAVILFDLDNFKRINDTYGHLSGDKVLQEISALGQKYLRDTDVLGRWGGEEFMIIAPGTDVAGATNLAEKLRQAIQDYDFTEVGTVMASFGVAVIREEERQGCGSLLKRMDGALYKAKDQGRNRVVSAD
ncbi:MAG: diguanylate cyclase [Desulfuromonadaceae bacterium]|nr:diguanylate cyclase [Desulfuromonadaceae bacterium]